MDVTSPFVEVGSPDSPEVALVEMWCYGAIGMVPCKWPDPTPGISNVVLMPLH